MSAKFELTQQAQPDGSYTISLERSEGEFDHMPLIEIRFDAAKNEAVLRIQRFPTEGAIFLGQEGREDASLLDANTPFESGLYNTHGYLIPPNDLEQLKSLLLQPGLGEISAAWMQPGHPYHNVLLAMQGFPDKAIWGDAIWGGLDTLTDASRFNGVIIGEGNYLIPEEIKQVALRDASTFSNAIQADAKEGNLVPHIPDIDGRPGVSSEELASYLLARGNFSPIIGRQYLLQFDNEIGVADNMRAIANPEATIALARQILTQNYGITIQSEEPSGVTRPTVPINPSQTLESDRNR